MATVNLSSFAPIWEAVNTVLCLHTDMCTQGHANDEGLRMFLRLAAKKWAHYHVFSFIS